MEYWGACLTGCEHFAEIDSALIIVAHESPLHNYAVIAVLLYHGGCYLEYKLGIKDTARVVPVHGVWWVIRYLLQEAVMCNVLL